MNPFDHLKRGDVDYFKGVELDVLQNSRDENSDTLFTKAAILNQLECCREAYRRCPSLLWHQNGFLNTALHHAIYYGASMRLIEFLIDCTMQTANEGDLEKGKKWLAIQNFEGETSLHYAVIKRSVEITQLLMDKDPDHELSKIANFERNTPLHMAVEYQHFELVKTLAIPEPDFEYCLNNEGETPLLIAMRKAVFADVTAVRIKRLLLEKQPNQCKAKTGERGWTALHHAASKGDEVMIEDIFQYCPECTDILDNDGHNFLHIAAKYEQVSLVKHILESKDIPHLLNGQDNYGNTPLHIAAEVGNKIMVLCFLYDSRVNKYTVNAKGQKVLDAITFDYDKEKAGVYGVRDRVDEKELKDQSDFDLVVGALIATVSFTAGITVPGGYISEGDDQGMAVLAKNLSFEIFVIANNFALVFSLYAVFSHFCTRRLLKKEDIVYQLNVATFCTLSAIFAMMVAFITGSYAVLAISNRLAIAVCVNSSLFFIFALRALWRMAMQHRRSTG